MSGTDYSTTTQSFLTYHIYLAPVCVIGVIGNVMVIMVVLRTKEMHNSTNISLISLAIADLIYLVTGGFIVLINETSSYVDPMIRREVMCNALPYLNFTVFNASTLTILAIGFDRYYAICQPLKAEYICTKRRAYKTTALVWVIAALSSSRNPLIWMYPMCDSWVAFEPNSQLNLDSKSYLYLIIITLVFFFLPLIILIVLFVSIFRRLKGDEAPIVNTAAIKHRHHVIKMLATVVCCFFICHLPFRFEVIFCKIAVIHKKVLKLVGEEGHSKFLLFVRLMLYIHSAVNPILYFMMSEKFRAGFKKIFFDIANGLIGLLTGRFCFKEIIRKKTVVSSIPQASVCAMA